MRNGRKNIVGFKTDDRQDRDSKQLQCILDDPKLASEGFGHLFSVCLVSWIESVAKSVFGGIESADQVRRRILLQERGDIPQESVNCSYLNPMGTGHRRQGMKDLVDQRVRVNQDNQIVGSRLAYLGLAA